MKSIEEASLDNSKLHYCSAFSEELHIDADIDFRKGIEFAQRWISVKDELPEEGEWVLCKSHVGDHYIGCSIGDRIRVDNITTITHWRPIELI